MRDGAVLTREDKGRDEQSSLTKPNVPSSPQRREQQITIEERTGQSFTDPAEKHSHRSAREDHEPSPDLGDDMDMGF
jgi:hypothetical protein